MSDKTFSAETKMKMSEAKLGENDPMFGLTHSEETKVLMSLALSGQNHPMYGKTTQMRVRIKLVSVKVLQFLFIEVRD